MGRIRIASLLLLSILSPGLLAQDDLGPAWKNQIAFPDDPFASWTSPAFIKFTFITKEGHDPNIVYFQDSTRYEYHYAFALEQLEPFIGMTIEQFDAVTLHRADQQAVLGRDPPAALARSRSAGVWHSTCAQRSLHTGGDRRTVSSCQDLHRRRCECHGILLPIVRTVPGRRTEPGMVQGPGRARSAPPLNGSKATSGTPAAGLWAGSCSCPAHPSMRRTPTVS